MGEYHATFQFHGLALRVKAEQSCAHLAAELERFWSAFQCGPTQRRDLVVSICEPPDWRPFEALQQTRHQAFFEDTKVAVGPEKYLIWSEDVVAVGSSSRIDVFCRTSRTADPKYIARFLVNLAFTEALRRRAIYYVHAACVESPDGRTYLISGDSGHGKTTLTLGLLQQGYRYLSDDAVFLDTRGGGFRVLGYHKAFHLSNSESSRALTSTSRSPVSKVDFDADRAFPGRRLRSTDHIDFILLPEITGASVSALKPVTPTELLTSFFRTSTSVFFEASLAAGHMHALQKLVTQAKGYRLLAGEDVLQNPQRYHEMFEELPCAA